VFPTSPLALELAHVDSRRDNLIARGPPSLFSDLRSRRMLENAASRRTVSGRRAVNGLEKVARAAVHRASTTITGPRATTEGIFCRVVVMSNGRATRALGYVLNVDTRLQSRETRRGQTLHPATVSPSVCLAGDANARLDVRQEAW
jgi:hypothetical protein